MVKANRIILVLIGIAVVVAVVALIVLLPRRDGRIDRLVDFANYKEAAIEREVAEAELAQYGADLVPGLRAELHYGSWRRSGLVQGVVEHLPQSVHDRFINAATAQQRRAERAVVTLGRLRTGAAAAIPDLQSVALGGRLAELAQVALTMIEPGNGQIQSNAIAALSASSQVRRVQFAIHAYEIWPEQPEVLDGSLQDADSTVRVFALASLGNYGRKAHAAAPLLMKMIHDPAANVRPRAALALGLVAPEHGTQAVAVMLDQQRTNNTWTGDHAYVLYQALGPAAIAAKPKLEADLADPKLSVVHGDAAGALWRITGKATPLIIAGLGDGVRQPIQRGQLRALRILGEIGPAAAGAVPAVSSLTNHPLVLIRKTALETLEKIRVTTP